MSTFIRFVLILAASCWIESISLEPINAELLDFLSAVVITEEDEIRSIDDYVYSSNYYIPVEIKQEEKKPVPVVLPNKEDVISLIKKWSEFYNINPKLPLTIAKCESGYNPLAKNSGSTASGVFQFIKSTWARNCEGNVFNAEDNIKCGVKLISEGGSGPWLASAKCWQ